VTAWRSASFSRSADSPCRISENFWPPATAFSNEDSAATPMPFSASENENTASLESSTGLVALAKSALALSTARR
jgi:hypothetical protein